MLWLMSASVLFPFVWRGFIIEFSFVNYFPFIKDIGT